MPRFTLQYARDKVEAAFNLYVRIKHDAGVDKDGLFFEELKSALYRAIPDLKGAPIKELYAAIDILKADGVINVKRSKVVRKDGKFSWLYFLGARMAKHDAAFNAEADRLGL